MHSTCIKINYISKRFHIDVRSNTFLNVNINSFKIEQDGADDLRRKIKKNKEEQMRENLGNV